MWPKRTGASRERRRQFDAETAVSIRTQSKQTVHLHKVVSTDPDEVRLYCYSEQRAEKERGIVERFAARFETAVTQLNDGLARPRAHKRLGQVWQRIGRLKARHSCVAPHYADLCSWGLATTSPVSAGTRR